MGKKRAGHRWEVGGGGRFLWCPRCENSIRPKAAVKLVSLTRGRPAVVWVNDENEEEKIPRCKPVKKEGAGES